MPGQISRLHTINTSRTLQAPQPRVKPRGLPPALEPHGVYTATNPAEAALFGRDLLGAHRVRIAPTDATAFEATYHAVLIRDISLGFIHYTTSVSLEVLELSEDYLVIVPANGSSIITNEGKTTETSPVTAATPMVGTPMRLECDQGAAHLVVRIDHQALGIHLSRLLGRTIDQPLQFDLEFNLAAESASRWNFALQMLHAEIYEGQSLLHRGVGLGQLEEFVMSSLLYCQRSNYSEQLCGTTHSQRHSVRVAKDFIEQNLALPISVSAIADAAGMSVRSLQKQFSEDLNQTPIVYLRNRRLERVRAELSDTPPQSGATVTGIAARWGFNHHGRFAVMYRTRFGQTPSQTLRS